MEGAFDDKRTTLSPPRRRVISTHIYVLQHIPSGLIEKEVADYLGGIALFLAAPSNRHCGFRRNHGGTSYGTCAWTIGAWV